MSDREEPTRYAVRVSERAVRDIEATYVFLAEQAGVNIANKWRTGLLAAITSLALLPERYALIPEEHFRFPVRHFTWQRAGSRMSHRILYTIEHEGNDGPFVRINHVRGATMQPITLEEAREIEAQQ